MNNKNGATVIVEKLVKHYKSGSTMVTAVDDVSFELPGGKMTAIKGASGCGKSTLLNLLGTLDKPTAGSIIMDGIKVSGMRGWEETRFRCGKVGFIFQSYYLVPNLSALENVMLPMEFLGVKRWEQKERASRLLAKVGIEDLKQNRRPTRLSGGEQQRVAIARALANDPAVILADEPTGNLDSKTGRRIIDLLYNLSQEGKMVILATHDAALAAKADIVLEMEDGKITGTPLQKEG